MLIKRISLDIISYYSSLKLKVSVIESINFNILTN